MGVGSVLIVSYTKNYDSGIFDVVWIFVPGLRIGVEYIKYLFMNVAANIRHMYIYTYIRLVRALSLSLSFSLSLSVYIYAALAQMYVTYVYLYIIFKALRAARRAIIQYMVSFILCLPFVQNLK